MCLFDDTEDELNNTNDDQNVISITPTDVLYNSIVYQEGLKMKIYNDYYNPQKKIPNPQ